MIAVDDRLDFAPPAPPGLWRGLGLAVIAHALLLAALAWGVNWKTEPLTLAAEAELWSALPQEAAPKAVAEAPDPAPEPPPPAAVTPTPPVVPPPPVPVPAPPTVSQADIALEKEKRLLDKQREQQVALEKQQAEKLKLEKLKQEQQDKLEKAKQDKLAQEKAAKDKQRREEQRALEKKLAEAKKLKAQAQERQAAQQAKEEAARIEAQRQANLKRMAGLAGASGSDKATGSALRAAGPSAGYAGRLRARIKPNIVFTENIDHNPVAEVEVRTSPDGTILQRKLIKSSGVPAWDEAVLKAIDKTATLPRDTDGRVPGELLITFRPKD